MSEPTMTPELFSLIIPVFNEEENIPTLIQRCTSALEELPIPYEILCVDDGSSDNTLELLVGHHQEKPQVQVLSLSRNFGHQAAVFAGLSYAKGSHIAIIDGDLQDPPECLPQMYDKMEEGWDVVYAVRKNRKEAWYKKGAYWLFYRLLKTFSENNIPLDSGDFCLMRRKVLDQLLQMDEQALFIRGLRAWVGFKQSSFEYSRDKRFQGRPKYSFKRLLRLAYSGLFGFSKVPIKIFGRLGMLMLLLGAAYTVYILIVKFLGGVVPRGFTTEVILLCLFGGVQLVGLGILGEYITRIYDEVRNRPLFLVQESHLQDE